MFEKGSREKKQLTMGRMECRKVGRATIAEIQLISASLLIIISDRNHKRRNHELYSLHLEAANSIPCSLK